MFALFTQASTFGLAAGTGFGPLHNLLMNVTLTHGWRHGLLIALSPLLTDGPIIVLMLVVLRQLPEGATRYLNIIGGFAILWIAWRGWLAYRHSAESTLTPTDAPADISRDTIIKGMMLPKLYPAACNLYAYGGGKCTLGPGARQCHGSFQDCLLCACMQ